MPLRILIVEFMPSFGKVPSLRLWLKILAAASQDGVPREPSRSPWRCLPWRRSLDRRVIPSREE
jgi:hypothetical protein